MQFSCGSVLALRRPSDHQSFTMLQGRQADVETIDQPKVWWRHCDLPAFVMHSMGGPDMGKWYVVSHRFGS